MLRKLTFGMLASVMALGVFAVPASAAVQTDLAWINGLPGKVDVCIGRTEIISNLRYGRAKFYLWEPGTFRFVIRKAAAGKCNGRKLGVVRTTIGASGDQTAVIWKPFRKLKIKVFDNDTTVEAGASSLVYRHMAKYPAAVDVWLWEHVLRVSDEFPPTFDDVRRGTSSPKVDLRPGQFYIDTYASRRTRFFGWEGFWGRTDPERYLEVYLVGTTKKNFKLVTISQAGDVAPAP